MYTWLAFVICIDLDGVLHNLAEQMLTVLQRFLCHSSVRVGILVVMHE